MLRKAGLDEGTFFVRPRNEPDTWVITVAFKGRPTQHLVTKDDGGLLVVNKRDAGGKKTIKGLIKHLGEAHPYWPVALTRWRQQHEQRLLGRRGWRRRLGCHDRRRRLRRC